MLRFNVFLAEKKTIEKIPFKNWDRICEIRILSRDQRIADVKIWAAKIDCMIFYIMSTKLDINNGHKIIVMTTEDINQKGNVIK